MDGLDAWSTSMWDLFGLPSWLLNAVMVLSSCFKFSVLNGLSEVFRNLLDTREKGVDMLMGVERLGVLPIFAGECNPELPKPDRRRCDEDFAPRPTEDGDGDWLTS